MNFILALRLRSFLGPQSRSSRALATLGFIVITLMATPSAKAQGYGVLSSFKGPGAGDAASPSYGALIQDAAGNLYGSTTGGGAHGLGAIFELVNTSSGYGEKVLYSFSGPDGDYPDGGLAIDGQGNLYGTAAYAGPSGQGVVFELVNSSGTYTEKTLYAFTGGSDGGTPSGGLVSDASGNLYGTTNGGGAGHGTFFELVNSTGTFTEKVLFNFPAGFANYLAGLTVDASGNFYGATLNAGAYGAGNVFELVNSSGVYAVQTLHDFSGTNGDGSAPTAGLTVDSVGNVYGATQWGGSSNSGIVYELVNSAGTYTEKVLYDFTNSGGNGAAPFGGVVLDASGNLYGATTAGGAYGQGTIYELVNSSGAYSNQILHSFDPGCAGDGASPQGALIKDASGNIYGTANQGGANGTGAVFEFLPASGAASLTSMTLTSSVAPATAGEPVQFTASILDQSGVPPSGNVTFSEGGTVLGTTAMTTGTCSATSTLMISDAEALGIGTYAVTAQYVPNVSTLASSSATMNETVNEAGVVLTTGNNTLTGTETVNGAVSATSFVGNGSGLTGVAAAGLNCAGCIGNSQLGINYAGSTSQGGAANSALSATNALMLGGFLPSSFLLSSVLGQPSGVASLDANGKVPAAQLPAAGGSGPSAILSGWCSGVVASSKGATFSFAGLGAGVGQAGTACSDGTGASTAVGIPITSAGTLANLQVYPGRASSAGTSLTFTVYKAAAPGWTFTTGPNQTTIGALSFARLGTRVTLTVATGASFASGDQISVSGISGTYSAGTNCTALSGALFDGTFTVSSSTATTVVYTDSSLPTNCGSNINNASASGTVADNTNPTTSNATKTAPTATALTCTIGAPSGSASLVCSDASHAVPVSAGDVISVVGTSARASGAETIGDIRVSLEKH
jgi:uncharacterized repeat protein (TIGR03803 family)